MSGDHLTRGLMFFHRWPRARVLWSAVGVILVVLVLLCISCFHTLNRPVHLAHAQSIKVTRETSFNYLCKKLHERGIVTNTFAFKVYGRLTGKAGKLKAGQYRITDGMSPVDILNMLVQGHAQMSLLTVPEGKWAGEISTLLRRDWPQAAEEFPAVITDMERWRRQVSFPLPGKSLEGYLFPDTYQFSADATADEIVHAMLTRFQQKCWAAYQADPPTDGRSLTDVLILASLVEAEAKLDVERPKIAGVYLNRLQENPPDFMACDATLLYAENVRKSRLFNRDKLVDSPYNTYHYRGLPPGPINNPGLKSFLAALHPDHHNYFYYVARGDGSHLFAHTAEEQTANIHLVRGK